MGSAMSQMSDSVGCSVNGSITAVAASGMINMSDALMGCQPRIDEPSKPKPFSNDASDSCDTGTVVCCHMPGKSMNFKSTITAPFSAAKSSTSFGFINNVS